MPTQANVPALKWHYTVLWHRSTVYTAAQAGLQLQVEGNMGGASTQNHRLEWKPCLCQGHSLGLHLPSSDNSLCKVTELYCTALSLYPAAGDGWDSFFRPFIGAPLRLHTVTGERDFFIGLHFALSIAHKSQITEQTLLD